MANQLLVALAGLGFFLAGLHLLSDVVRALAARQVRAVLNRIGTIPFSSALTGSLLGAVTQSTSASAYVCIGLLHAKAITFPAALSISAWSGVGTSLLVFLASVDLRLAALVALAMVAMFYLTALHRHDAGRRTTELLLATGVTFLGLAMVKEAGHGLEGNVWAQEFLIFSSESWIYGFLIGLMVTLVLQSSSTVSILAVAMSATGFLPLQDAIILVCGANVGSGLSVALVSSHLLGLPRQLALWQSIVKALGSVTVLALVPLIFGPQLREWDLTDAFSVPTLIAISYLVLNLSGALLAGMFQPLLMRLLEKLAPTDGEKKQFEPAFIIDEAVEDPETARLLARQEQARLMTLLPHALAPLRTNEITGEMRLTNTERRSLSVGLTNEIAAFISEAIRNHPQNSDVSRLLILQRYNDHILSLVETIHTFVEELSGMKDPAVYELTMRDSMTETLHFLLSLAADQAQGDIDEADMLVSLTRDRSEVMTRFRNQIALHDTPSHTNREALFVATGLFERVVWLLRQISSDRDRTHNTSATASA
jgi:phosphate:Na+ symporter